MKRVLLSIAIFCLSLPLLGQSFHYYPLKEVKDTIQYLKLNFDNQSSYFKGKTFDEFWQIIRRDISPKKCNKIETSPFVDPHGEVMLVVLSLHVWIPAECPLTLARCCQLIST